MPLDQAANWFFVFARAYMEVHCNSKQDMVLILNQDEILVISAAPISAPSKTVSLISRRAAQHKRQYDFHIIAGRVKPPIASLRSGW